MFSQTNLALRMALGVVVLVTSYPQKKGITPLLFLWPPKSPLFMVSENSTAFLLGLLRKTPGFTVSTFATLPFKSCVYRTKLILGNVGSEEIHVKH